MPRNLTNRYRALRIALAAALAASAPFYAAEAFAGNTIQDKTLVAWVTVANLDQRGGSVLTLDNNAGHFDGIVLGELTPGKWMAGSNFFERTQRDQSKSPAETADPKTLLQLAIAYQGREVRIYRNGVRYAGYKIGEPQSFGPGSAVVMGLRHLTAGDPAYFAGTIDDARIYDRALSVEQIAALRPRQPSEPKPLAWFSFEGGTARDRMGKFPVVELLGGACVADGKLHLSGQGAHLIATETAQAQFTSPIHYRPRHGVFADPIPFFWKGDYHVFYLRGAAGPVPWEHIVSRDLVHWKELPTALKVDGAHDGPDGGAMFTGSVVHGEGQFHIFYTGDNGANPKGTEFIMHATSPDLVVWTKHPEEIIAPDPAYYKNARIRDFRDPHVSWHEHDKRYWMVFFANDAKTGAGVQGLALSKDLKHWEFQPPLPAAGGQECPDLFQIGDTWYLIGGDRYTIAKDPHGPYARPPVSDIIDRPFVYAAKRMFDGQRHIWTGWLWDRAGFCDSGQSQWGGTQCLPRELYAGPGGQLYCRPVPEVSAVFNRCMLDLAQRPALAISSQGWGYTADGLVGSGDAAGSSCALAVPDHYMLQCKLALDPKAVFTLTMRQGQESGSGYALALRPEKQEAAISSNSFREARRIELDASRPIALQAFVQGSMIETFINGQYAISCRGYDYATGKLGLSVSGGKAKVLELKVNVCPPAGPVPTHADVSYGPSPHQIMDLYLPTKKGGPFPALIWYGGIWEPGKNVPGPNGFLAEGIAVIGVETRTLTDGMQEKANPPVSYVMNDACRAVQFLRLNAARWNLDPRRIAVGGGSQGTLPALYVGCAGDRANPKSGDPVERVSTRVTCVAAYRSQPSIDPGRMQQWVPGVKWGAPSLGCSFEESLQRRDELLPLIGKWSPDALLHKGAPPIYFENEWGLTQPEHVTVDDYKVHSPAWALGFQKLAQRAGVVCHAKYPGHPTDGYKDIWDFIRRELTVNNQGDVTKAPSSSSGW